MSRTLSNSHIGVIGLGYVGMPLALMLAKNVRLTGFDTDAERVKELSQGIDRNQEIETSLLKSRKCDFTNDLNDIKNCNVFIITVPTPVDENNKPDLRIVESATKTVASVLKKGDIVVYESTVYPGVTEDFCGPLLEQNSGLKSGHEFFLGYSPERINPGDAERTVQKITKVVAGQTDDVADFLVSLYGLVNGGNIFRARDIRTAEASKVIENAQRDINVAFINEVTIVLNKLNLSAHDVLEAAGTKWNFLKFTPGLVGGHCIGVDPYYLAECAKNIGYNPKIILAGRHINEGMGPYIAECIHALISKSNDTKGKGRILLLGFTFKENINDIRNTKVIDIFKSLKTHGYEVDIHDPHARPFDVYQEYGFKILDQMPEQTQYDGVALVVAHSFYKDMALNSLQKILKLDGVIYDMKGIWRDKSSQLKKFSRYHTL